MTLDSLSGLERMLQTGLTHSSSIGMLAHRGMEASMYVGVPTLTKKNIRTMYTIYIYIYIHNILEIEVHFSFVKK